MKTALPFLLLPAVIFALPGHADPVAGFVAAPASREESRVFYNTVYAASVDVPSGWTGSVADGVAGTTSQAYKDAVRRRVNYYRAMAGVPANVVFSEAFDAADQQAALMESANNSDSHAPTADFIDYTAAGANADADSNLALGTVEEGPVAIDGYIAEGGSSNVAAGHRRWVLYPPQTTMGTGDVDASGLGAPYAANALWVIDTASFASPAPAPRDGFVAWPPPGYVPYTLISPRWSFSIPGADFSAATVSMTRRGAAVAVQLETPENGYGDNTLVWVPDGEDPTKRLTPTAPASELPTTVTVSNVLIGGAAQSFTYSVTAFDPGVAGADTVLPVLNGPANPAMGAANVYTFNAVPNATGYRWSAGTILPLTLSLDAENGPGDVTISPVGTNVISTANPASGAASYHFASHPAETMTLNAVVLPQAGATLTFRSQLELATVDETARVQISTDGGATWADLYSLSGSNVPGPGSIVAVPTEPAYAAHSLDLSAYAGEICRLRFVYAFAFASSGISSFFPPYDFTGWYVDDIALTGAQTLSTPMVTDLPAGQTQFAFNPAAVGTYGLQVVPLFYGAYTTDAGPLFNVAAVDAAFGVGPAVTVAASAGTFVLTRAGSDLSAKIVLHYVLKGSAKNGQDFVALSGKAKIKPNKVSTTVSVVPLSGGAGKVKLVLKPGDGYSMGAPDRAVVRIVP